MTWEETASKKKQAVFDKIPKEWLLAKVPSVDEEKNAIEFIENCGALTPQELAITNKTLLELRDAVSTKELSSHTVISAFCHRAALAHQLVNCCSEIFFERALARAKELDDHYERTGQLVGPLHGLPVSLKDQVNLEGLDSALGFVAKTGHPKTKDEESIIATILQDAGAVFYVKTAVPMSLMAPDTFSNIYGETVNPQNRLLSTGGSSGGEGALIASKGSVIGLSTDIGGSIRIPAALNGLFALKPSTGRLPYGKITNSWEFQPIMESVVGPSANDLKSLELFVKTILDAKPWLYDPKTPPIPFREVELPKKLTVGIMKSNGFITPHPPILRALDLIKEKLEAQGHEVIEFEHPINLLEFLPLAYGIFLSDGYKYLKDLIAESGEPAIPQLMSSSTEGLEEIKVSQHWEQARAKYNTQMAYDKAWLNTKGKDGRVMDCFISPVWESASYPAGDVRDYHCSYTLPMNILDYPACVVPITHVKESDNNKQLMDYEPLNERDAQVKELWDYELFQGMPVAVQIATMRYEEEKALKIGQVVYNATH